jgi:pimeloyl-ACP methyl ester carboxylesterase
MANIGDPAAHALHQRMPRRGPPAIAEANHRKITGSEWVVFEQSSHAAHLVEEDEFRRVVNDFTGRSLY